MIFKGSLSYYPLIKKKKKAEVTGGEIIANVQPSISKSAQHVDVIVVSKSQVQNFSVKQNSIKFYRVTGCSLALCVKVREKNKTILLLQWKNKSGRVSGRQKGNRRK